MEQHYYMDMPRNPVEVDDKVEEINIENISDIERGNKGID
jgi:hypothetical protein